MPLVSYTGAAMRKILVNPATLAVMILLLLSGGRADALPQGTDAGTVTTTRVLELLRGGATSSGILSLLNRQAGEFDLTVEDVVRLRRAGATPALILKMAESTNTPDESVALLPGAIGAADGDLTIKQVLKMYRHAAPPSEITAEIARRGLKVAPTLDDLVSMRQSGVPVVIVSALARGKASTPSNPELQEPAAAIPPHSNLKPVAATGPLAIPDILARLASGSDQAALIEMIDTRGIKASPSLDEALALRRARASQDVLDAISDATPSMGAPATTKPRDDDATHPLAESPSMGSPPITIGGPDRLYVSSVPTGARVYVASARTPTIAAIGRDNFVGNAPLEVTLEPGDWQIILSHDAGPFENTLLPAWRTIYDTQMARTVLDNADLTFDPNACCLPGSLGGTVTLRSAAGDDPRRVMGDQFDGLSPWLFDGESLQIARIRSGAIREVMKLYHLRKRPGQARLLTGTFLAAEGDPLGAIAGEASLTDEPFDSFLDDPALAYLEDDAGTTALAQTLGFEVEHLREAIEMLRRTGKALLHQQVEGGLRIVTLALDEGGRLRVTDQAFRPTDPFAPAVAMGRKQSATKSAPPPLPAATRTVIPGLGAPRLAVNNTTRKAVALLFSDGQFCFAPPSSRIECLIDPGSFDVRLAAPQSGPTPAQSRMHFSWHARYSLSF